jgi:NAD(P)-dependent dehydrogenase (short-subunit alcohol dehydrogenase family)/catechol 2,3-dioxygenase-like lactoylglutathione lyase family enzyme
MPIQSAPTALITGASRGLGLALARQLARRGWTLIIDARGAAALDAARAELADIARVIAIPGDVTDPIHRLALAEAAEQVGGLDAVVNNASILGPSPQPNLLDYPINVLEQVYRANVIAPLAVIQVVRQTLKPGARIINITSDAAVEPYEGWGGYGSSKAALEQLSHILAAENPDLRVYWVDPGDMRTQMHQEAFPGEDISDRPLPEVSVPGLLALLTSDYPSGRYTARAITPPAPAGMDVTSVTGSAISVEPLPAGAEGALSTGTPDATLEAAAGNALAAAAPPAVREVRVALTVEDFEQIAQLYRDGFSLPVVKEWNTPEGRGIILDAGRGTVEILDRADAAYTDQVEAGRRVSGPVRLAFAVADVATAAAALQAHGASALGGPVVTSWGNPSQRLQAPDGMQLTLFQAGETES